MHNDTHRPDVAARCVWAANARKFSREILRILTGEEKLAGLLVERVVNIEELEVGEAEKTRDIRIVHEEMLSVTIYLVGENEITLRALHDSVPIDGFPDDFREGAGSFTEVDCSRNIQLRLI